MPHHASALKRLRRDDKRQLINHARLSRIRTFVKKVETSVAKSFSKDHVLEAFRNAQSELMRGVTKGILHRNTASRKIGRLAQKIKKAQQEPNK